MKFKEWLRAEMDARGMNPSKLAGIAKVPQPTIFRILSGETKDPRTGTVKKIERALKAESPPLDIEQATDEYPKHADLIAAWDSLLPDEQAELMENIQRRAAHNRAVLEHAAKPATEAKPPPKMPATAVTAGPPKAHVKKTVRRAGS